MNHRFWVLPALALALATSVAAAQAKTITVTVDKMAFSPATIEAKVGDTVEWVNKDAFAHTATVKGGWEVMLPIRKSGSVTMDKAGTINYFCRFHPNMKGTINVAP
ncbi:MAG: cupredoxin family copper-binding protein [Mesorhizobium sp.]